MRVLCLGVLATVLVALPAIGCSCPVHAVRPTTARSEWRSSLTLYRHPLEVRLSQPETAGPQFLVLYATGDGGWHGLDQEIYEWISAEGYPTAGISSPSYLKDLGYESQTTTPARLVRDFSLIIDYAEGQLGLPESTPVILVGLSRGAGLSTVAAGQGGLRNRVAGLLAIALTREEEYVRHYSRRERRGVAGAPKSELVEIKTYEYLSGLPEIPAMVIQSSGDNYVSAAAARGLFGPDTPLRRLRAVDARNHSFGGGCETLYQETLAGLDWISGIARLAASRDP